MGRAQLLEQVISNVPAQHSTSFEEKLEDLIQDKISLHAPEPESSTSIDISHFGFQRPDDLRKFLLTPAGETVKHDIAEKIAEDQAMEQERLFQAHEQLLIQERRRVLLYLWLMDKEANANSVRNELIELKQREKAIQNKTKALEAASAETSALSTIVQEYTQQIEDLDTRHQDLSERIHKLEAEGELIEDKHVVYKNRLDDFDKVANEYEKSIEKAQDRITALQAQADKIVDDMNKIDDEKLVHQKMNELNAINLEIASLNDIVSKQKTEKRFVGENGEDVDGFDKATFILANDQSIIKDENGQYYLVKRGQTWDDIKNSRDPDEAKKDAKKLYNKAKNDIHTVRDVVKEVNSQEITLNTTRISDHKKEQLMIKNQITSLQSARANAQNMINEQANTLSMNSPRGTVTSPIPTISSSSSMSQKTSFNVAAHINTRINSRKSDPKFKQFTWKDLFNFVETIPNEHQNMRDKTTKFLEAELNKSLGMLGRLKAKLLSEQPRMAPIPEVTMNSLLKTMATFGVNPHAVGPEKSELVKNEEAKKSSVGPTKSVR